MGSSSSALACDHNRFIANDGLRPIATCRLSKKRDIFRFDFSLQVAAYERQQPEVNAGMETEMDDGFLAALLRSLNVNYNPAQVLISSEILCKLTLQHGHDVQGIIDWALRGEPQQAREQAEDEEVD